MSEECCYRLYRASWVTSNSCRAVRARRFKNTASVEPDCGLSAKTMWTRRRAAWCATDTNKHQCRPQINTSHPVWQPSIWHVHQPSQHTHREDESYLKDVEPLLEKYCVREIFFISAVPVMLQWLYTAWSCWSSGLRPQLSGDHGLSHLHSSETSCM